MLVGRVIGSLEFEDPLKGGTFTLGDDDGLSPGDPWQLPYVGIPHNLSARHELYFWDEDESEGRKMVPPRQDSNLVSALRSIRRHGAIRFLVNPEGVVLTKKSGELQPWRSNEHWEPIYVGRVDRRVWFEMEE